MIWPTLNRVLPLDILLLLPDSHTYTNLTWTKMFAKHDRFTTSEL